MTLHPSTLPQLPSGSAPSSSHPVSAPPQGSANSRPKRRLSNATQLSMDDDDLAMMDDDFDEEELSTKTGTRSKRSRPTAGVLGGGGGGSYSVGNSPKQQVVGKALTEKEKEARRVARMIRNRNAAQASRDRKKEHTAFLERRVADLEAQLRGKAVVPVGTASHSSSSQSASTSRHSRSQREASVSSSVGSASSDVSGRIADLEDENDGLRSQLHLEQVEKAQLRSRLDHLEDKLGQLSHLLGHSPSPSFFAGGTSTPLPRFEPTFAYDTPNLSPLPQPEERAYLEQRDREQYERRRISGGALGLRTTPPPFSADEDKTQEQDQRTAPAPALSTAEAVANTAVPAIPAAVSATPSPASSIASLSPLPCLLPPFEDDDYSSTPPSLPESYLELEPVDVSSVWTEWAKGSLPSNDDSEVVEPTSPTKATGDDDSALAFIDLSFLQDAPTTA
ncbi:hypothetical protein JCM11251_006964 [Rhodosporidiobolus azoricus]